MDPRTITVVLLCIVAILVGGLFAEYSVHYEKHTINASHIEYNALNRTLKINNKTYNDINNLTYSNGTFIFYTKEESDIGRGLSLMFIAGGVMGIIVTAMRRWDL